MYFENRLVSCVCIYETNGRAVLFHNFMKGAKKRFGGARKALEKAARPAALYVLAKGQSLLMASRAGMRTALLAG